MTSHVIKRSLNREATSLGLRYLTGSPRAGRGPQLARA